jgi:dienelactone hydrolase
MKTGVLQKLPLLVWTMGVAIALLTHSQPAPAQSSPVRTSYVAFQTLDPAKPLAEAGVLRLPLDARRPMPAVVIVHGSNGIDSRGAFYAAELNQAGIATLEIDMWAARGITGAEGRPKGVPETLPDAYAAFKLLAANPAIDSKRIGIMGFSWGGLVSMLSATRPYSERYLGSDAHFAAHAPTYPVCWVYNRVPGYELKEFTGAPILLQAGELDDYDQPDTCKKLVESLDGASARLVSLKIYPNAGHAWDRLEPAMTVNDPYSHLGKGGEVRIAPNEATAAASRAATVSFFRCTLGLGGCVP